MNIAVARNLLTSLEEDFDNWRCGLGEGNVDLTDGFRGRMGMTDASSATRSF